MDITNKSKKPLSIPLPAGKKLFLAPGKSGQITRKAAERPAVIKLIESGEVKVSAEIGKREGSRGVTNITTTAPGYTGSKSSDH